MIICHLKNIHMSTSGKGRRCGQWKETGTKGRAPGSRLRPFVKLVTQKTHYSLHYDERRLEWRVVLETKREAGESSRLIPSSWDTKLSHTVLVVSEEMNSLRTLFLDNKVGDDPSPLRREEYRTRHREAFTRQYIYFKEVIKHDAWSLVYEQIRTR